MISISSLESKGDQKMYISPTKALSKEEIEIGYQYWLLRHSPFRDSIDNELTSARGAQMKPFLSVKLQLQS